MEATAPVPTTTKPPTRVRKVLTLLGSMLLGGIAGGAGTLFFMLNLPDVSLGAGTKLLIAAGLIPLLPLLVAVHEGGHLLGGRLAGFRALLCLVGPLRVERVGERWRVGLNRKLALAGGLAVSVPTDTRDLRRRTLLMIAGGPAANLLGGIVFLALWRVLGLHALPATASAGQVYASVALLTLGLLSFLLLGVALLPAQGQGFSTDGARILTLLRPGAVTDREVAVMALMGLSLGGQRPREWDPELVTQVLALPDGSPFHVAGLQMAYAHALDAGDLAAARRHLEAAMALLEALPKMAHAGLLLEGAWFAAAHDGDAARARELLDRAGPGLLVGAHTRLLAEGAVRLAEGDAAGALERAEQAGAQLHKAVDAGSIPLDADRIAALRADATERLQSAAV